MDISCAFAPQQATPAHIAHAEELGYRRAWCFDSPALYADVWMILGMAAERTTTIELGPAVLVPTLRHPLVNAAAIAALAAAAPGRVVMAVGAGFTGRVVLGQRPMRWTDVAAYVRVMRALLRGDEVEWEGQTIRMLHPDGFAAHRPLDVPLLIAADGPKGLAVAGELGDGVFSTMPSTESDAPWRALLISGTVLAEREDAGSERVIDTVGPALARIFHGRYERAGAAGVDSLPGGRRWREVIEAVPRGRRHLAVHEGHLVEVNERDRPAVIAGAGLIPEVTMTATAAEIRARVADLAEAGFTEIAYQPMGPDIPRELEAFAAATSELG